MEEKTKHYLAAIASSLLGGALLVVGVYVLVDAWATMNLIEGRGVLGQAAYQEEYKDAVFKFKIAAITTLGGGIFLLNSAVEDLKTTLWKIRDEA